MTSLTVGTVVHDFFVDYLRQQKGLRQSSVRSYRDTLRLFLPFVAKGTGRAVSRLQLAELSLEQVLGFLRHIETDRHNSVATRNQRLAALRTFFEYLGRRSPEALRLCEQIAVIPSKRTPMPDTRFISRDDVQALFSRLPSLGRLALRDRALLLFLYNTGARVQEVSDLRIAHLTLERPPSVRLFGKGGKWRACPLWQEPPSSLLCSLVDAYRSRTAPCLYPVLGDRSRALGFTSGYAASPPMSRPQALAINGACLRTSGATRRPSICWKPVSMSTSSGVGSGTSVSPRPIVTPRSRRV
jgi:site-specific recombinase XerD